MRGSLFTGKSAISEGAPNKQRGKGYCGRISLYLGRCSFRYAHLLPSNCFWPSKFILFFSFFLLAVKVSWRYGHVIFFFSRGAEQIAKGQRWYRSSSFVILGKCIPLYFLRGHTLGLPLRCAAVIAAWRRQQRNKPRVHVAKNYGRLGNSLTCTFWYAVMSRRNRTKCSISSQLIFEFPHMFSAVHAVFVLWF